MRLHVNRSGRSIEFVEPGQGQVALLGIEGLDTADAITDGRAVLPDLERPQNPQLHRWKRTHVAIVIRAIQRGVKVE